MIPRKMRMKAMFACRSGSSLEKKLTRPNYGVVASQMERPLGAGQIGQPVDDRQGRPAQEVRTDRPERCRRCHRRASCHDGDKVVDLEHDATEFRTTSSPVG